jgi:pimeloyl-ACP methyl ester carboxylesterase
VRGPSLSDHGVHKRTFFVPGVLGFGSSSLLSRLFPYFTGIRNIDVVDVGPVSSVDVRAERLFAHIRLTYPEWSDVHPVNLVGHSAGCNTILALALMDHVSPESINSIVFISPPMGGCACTHMVGRYGDFHWYWVWLLNAMLLYEFLIPECVRRTLLLHTLLPPNLKWGTRTAEWSVFWDMEESESRKIGIRGVRYLQKHKIRWHSFISSISVEKEGSFRIPMEVAGPLIRLISYLLQIGSTTDYDQGYSLISEDVSAYSQRIGHHDGILLTRSQYVLYVDKGVDHYPETLVYVDHLGPVLMGVFQNRIVRFARRRLMYRVIDYLLASE